MKNEEITGVDALSNFLLGSQAILFEVASSNRERYQFVELIARKTRYLNLKQKDKRIVRKFLIKDSNKFYYLVNPEKSHPGFLSVVEGKKLA